MYKVILFLFAYILSGAVSTGAQDLICQQCKGRITENYLIVEGLPFHKAHFLCFSCGKPIEGAYNKKDNKFYHAACFSKNEGLVCSSCGNLITEAFLTVAGKKYHKECYEGKVAVKCAVCLQPILAESQIDEYGNVFHQKHIYEYKKCENCGRLICERITGGGKKYSDGRDICYLCSAQAVYENQIIRVLFSEVKDKLRSLGIIVPENISIEGVDRIELKRRYDGDVSPEMKGFCGSTEEIRMTGNKKEKPVYRHNIYILNGVPAGYLSATIAHELLHAWIFENAGKDLPPQIAEGSCNFASYLYLKDKNDNTARIIIKRLHNSDDPVYGDGFRTVFQRFAGKPVSDFLAFLKKEGMKK